MHPVYDSLVQGGPVEGGTAFQQNAVNAHLSQAFCEGIQIYASLTGRKEEDFTALFFIGKPCFSVRTAGGQYGPGLGAGGSNLGIRRCAKLRIADNPHRIPGIRETACKQGIIGQYGSHTAHDSRIPASVLMDPSARSLPGNPSGMPGKGGCLAVQCHGVFHDNKGPAGLYVVKEYVVEFPAFFFQDTFCHFNAVGY